MIGCASHRLAVMLDERATHSLDIRAAKSWALVSPIAPPTPPPNSHAPL
jgi:hypothetical protein